MVVHLFTIRDQLFSEPSFFNHFHNGIASPLAATTVFASTLESLQQRLTGREVLHCVEMARPLYHSIHSLTCVIPRSTYHLKTCDDPKELTSEGCYLTTLLTASRWKWNLFLHIDLVSCILLNLLIFSFMGRGNVRLDNFLLTWLCHLQ